MKNITLVAKDNNNIITGYMLNRVNVTRKNNEKTVAIKSTEYSLFDCVADHTGFSAMLNAYVFKFDTLVLESEKTKLENKELTSTLTDTEKDRLSDINAMITVYEKSLEDIKTDIPSMVANKKLIDFPFIIRVYASFICGYDIALPVETIKNLVNAFHGKVKESDKIDITNEVANFKKWFNESDMRKSLKLKKDSVFKSYDRKIKDEEIRLLLTLASADIDKTKYKVNAISDNTAKKILKYALIMIMSKEIREEIKESATTK